MRFTVSFESTQLTSPVTSHRQPSAERIRLNICPVMGMYSWNPSHEGILAFLAMVSAMESNAGARSGPLARPWRSPSNTMK